MTHFIFDTAWGWVGTAGIIVVICLVVGYVIPQFRLYGLAVIGVVVSAASIYAKGNRDRANLEAKRRDDAVKKAQGDYAKIDARRDTPADVAKRLQRGDF